MQRGALTFSRSVSCTSLGASSGRPTAFTDRRSSSISAAESLEASLLTVRVDLVNADGSEGSVPGSATRKPYYEQQKVGVRPDHYGSSAQEVTT